MYHLIHITPRALPGTNIAHGRAHAGIHLRFLDVELHEDHGEDGIGEDHEEDRLHHGDGGQPAELARRRAHLHAAQRTDQRDQHREDRRLDHAYPEGVLADRALDAVDVLPEGNVDEIPGQDRAADESHGVGDDRQDRQRDDEAQDARDHQYLDRIHPHGAQRVDLVVQLHGADLGRERAARAAGDDDGGQQHAELAQHRDSDEIDDEDLAAELPELLRADVGDDHRDQEGDQRHDRHRGEARLVDVAHDRGQAQALHAPEDVADAGSDDADEAEQVERAFLHLDGSLPDVLQRAFEPGPRRARVGWRLRFAGHRLIDEREQVGS